MKANEMFISERKVQRFRMNASRRRLGQHCQTSDATGTSPPPAATVRKLQCSFMEFLNLKTRYRTPGDGRCIRATEGVGALASLFSSAAGEVELAQWVATSLPSNCSSFYIRVREIRADTLRRCVEVVAGMELSSKMIEGQQGSLLVTQERHDLVEHIQPGDTKTVVGLKFVDYETRLAVPVPFLLEYGGLRGDLLLTYTLFEQGERQLLNEKNKTDPGNLGGRLDPVYQWLNPRKGQFRSKYSRRIKPWVINQSAFGRILGPPQVLKMSSSVSQVDGVAQLQLARTAALAKVDEARARRARRLKAAKDEAKAEVDLYKMAQDNHYRRLEEQIQARQGDFEESSRRATAEQLDMMNRSYAKNKEVALTTLLSAILNVQPRVHANFSRIREQ
ncbi:vacuolar ATP synthase subunit G [Clonorchis sinensis]|uniref:Vacuolar ATP synthase subunit G n=1 Tax=Clonorchis sinensis TaxID=79923 RepID=H2KVM4_CLOSI|nr:vacuolar ATP synthase subunit G [Clonorchis sinensis]